MDTLAKEFDELFPHVLSWPYIADNLYGFTKFNYIIITSTHYHHCLIIILTSSSLLNNESNKVQNAWLLGDLYVHFFRHVDHFYIYIDCY